MACASNIDSNSTCNECLKLLPQPPWPYQLTTVGHRRRACQQCDQPARACLRPPSTGQHAGIARAVVADRAGRDTLHGTDGYYCVEDGAPQPCRCFAGGYDCGRISSNANNGAVRPCQASDTTGEKRHAHCMLTDVLSICLRVGSADVYKLEP